MAADPSYLFNGSNIGPFGVQRDAQNVPEMMYFIIKKNLGIINTVPDKIYNNEVGGNSSTNIPNSFSHISQNKLYAQNIPLSNPMITRFSAVSITLNNFVFLDPSFRNTTVRFMNRDTLSENTSSRYVSCNFPYICFYSNLLLTPCVNSIVGTVYNRFIMSYGHPLLQRTISRYFDRTYYPFLYYSNTGSNIEPNDGYWLLDPDAGIVTFYDSNTGGSQVNSNNPPRISFFRYEGLFGEANILSSQEF